MTNKQPAVFVSLDRENIEAYTPKCAVDIIIPYLKKNEVIDGRNALRNEQREILAEKFK